MADPSPVVSVIVPAFNAAGFIGRALESLRAQTFADYEVLIVDDASTDETASIIAATAGVDQRLRLLHHTVNAGPAAARNTGLDAARGAWIALLDADDAWRPDRLAAMLAAADQTRAEVVADNQILYDDAADREVRTAVAVPDVGTALTLKMLLDSEFEGSPHRLGLLKPLIARAALDRLGLRWDPALRYAEDFRLYAELLANRVQAWLMPEPLYVYTMPVGTLSGRRSNRSRTVTAVASRIGIADDLLRTYAATLTADETEGLVGYRNRAERRLLVQEMTSLKEQRKYLRLGAFLATHPSAAWHYISSSRTFRALAGQRSPATS